MSAGDNEANEERVMGFEPTAFSLGNWRRDAERVDNSDVTLQCETRCTSGCTNEGQNMATDDQLQTVVDAWDCLPDVVKAGIVAMVKASRQQ
ncbi:MAG: hypothetical protein H6824_08430 [Planctomycetaceae bacterium]|nr:hypothetical protein [Planctomycetaceae bacterium]